MLPATPNLLLVDDDQSLVRILHRMITRALGDRLSVQSCEDSEVALTIIEEGRVDVLLTDLEMPGNCGLELLQRAKQRNAFTQVLLLTGQYSHEHLLSAMEHGATDYLLKPVEKSTLIELLNEVLGRRQRWLKALAASWQRRQPAARSS